MDRRPLVATSLAVTGVMTVAGAWAWTQLPEGTQVPIHWNIDGRPDDWADRTVALALLPLLALGLTALFAVLPSLEPRRRHIEQSWRGYRAIWLSLLVLVGAMHAAIVAVALGTDVDIARFTSIGVGLLVAIIGNYLPTVRSNWFMGVRTPWTLSSERSWDRTHRFGGRLFVVVGLATAGLGLVDIGPVPMFVVLMGGLLAASVSMVVYSYLAWRDDPTRRAT